MSEEKKAKNLSRRDFIKGTAVGAVSIAAVTMLPGCAPTTVTEAAPTSAAADSDAATAAPVSAGATTAPSSASTSGLTADTAAQKWAFEIPPAPIADSQIANTVTADIIVVGGGHAGLVTANSAAENGAKVILISAAKAPSYRGGSMHAAYSKVMQKAGIDRYDVDRFFRRELSNSSYNVDQDKWWKFYNNSEEAMNWLIDKMEAAGYTCVLEVHNTEPDNGPTDVPAGSHSFISKDMTAAGSGAQFTAETLAKTAIASGVQIFYQTIAKQLVRENNNTGRVTAVIAQTSDGKYTKYVGTKAIVLATGDFSADKDMMTKYCPWAMPLLSTNGDQGYDTNLKIGGLFKGDGQKMGLWIGAAWQKTFPAAPMLLIGAGGAGLPSNQPYGAHRGLIVNKNGYRYGNEDVSGSFAGVAMMHQPEMKAYAIWGTNYAKDAAPWYQFGMRLGDDAVTPDNMIAKWEKAVAAKTMVKGDTIEDVIKQLNLPADATKATVDKYNGFCQTGIDTDFHKRKEQLIPIADGPFYGAQSDNPTFLTVLGGLRTNLNMQVCDDKDQPIPGLFNVGTMVGDYYANCYSFSVQGNNYGGNCLTFGYLTGKAIAKGTI
jgi:succinate dehydrogenase/fumarate reductase flavoprotein subunit